MSKQDTILVTGANGQLGTELSNRLREIYPSVIASDLRIPENPADNFVQLDVTNKDALVEVLRKYKVKQIYHLAAILSATGEKNPALAWSVNLGGGLNILEAAVEEGISKVFWPSSIAVFGPNTPTRNTPQYTVTDPETIYGITKLAGERLSVYFYKNKGLDIRSLRYPGLISYKTLPGGGTTDYAVEIYHAALKDKAYTCFLGPDIRLPMMFIDDAIEATIQLMESPAESVKVHDAYNLAAMSFTPAEIAKAIQEHIPEFEIRYEPDFREKIARTWPASIDDSAARSDWAWQHQYDLAGMTKVMLDELSKSL